MKKKKSKKKQTNSNLKDQKLGQTKNSAKLVLFVFGIGPIIGIIIFLSQYILFFKTSDF